MEGLASATECGDAYAGAVVAVAGRSGMPPSAYAAAIRTAPAACRVVLLESVSAIKEVDASLVDAVQHETPLDEAWLALGDLARIARPADATLAERIDDVLAAAPRSRVVIGAAGNAGCVKCLPAIVSTMSSADDAERRTAVGALRFIERDEAVAVACAALEHDPSDRVRDMAAWALGFSNFAEDARTTCLIRAAALDEEKTVRSSAVHALAAIAPTSKRALSAVAHLTGEDHPKDVRAIALAFLEGEGAPLLIKQ